MNCKWRGGAAFGAWMLLAPTAVLTTIAVAQAQQPRQESAEETFSRVCGACHSTAIATSSRRTRHQWLQTVGQMRSRGAAGSDDDFRAIVDYLSEHYGRVNVNVATAAEIETATDFSSGQADAIVAYRRVHGTINDFDELRKVPGLDPAQLQANTDAFTFGVELPGIGRVPISALTQSNDWPTVAGNPQRDGWASNEALLGKETVHALKLLYKYKFVNQSMGLRTLTSPVVRGALYGPQGIKQMLIVGGSSDAVYSIDADLDRQIWSRRLELHDEKTRAAPSASCPDALTALAIPGTNANGGSAFGDFFHIGPILAVSSDGYLHTMYQSDGSDENAPIRIVPEHSKVSSLNLYKTSVYVTTVGNCGPPNGIYGVNTTSPDRKVASFATNGSGPSGTAGTAIGSDGTVYAQIAKGQGDVAGKYSDTVLALTSNGLQVKDYFTPSGSPPTFVKDTELQEVTPAVFQWKGKDVIVSGGRDGRLYLLDSSSLGGTDHHTALDRTDPVAATNPGSGFRGAFATWQDPDTQTRWIYASLSGPANSGAIFPLTNGAVQHGGIAAFRVEDRNGKPALALAWISRDMITPAAPVIANGLVFALSSGQPARLVKNDGTPYSTKELERMAKTAVLYVLDADTGKELFSSGNAASSFSYGSELAVANGQVYFATHDNTVYVYGIPMEH